MSLEIRQSEILDVAGALEIHPYARSRVYDLRRYRAANFWGPFMDDGSGRIDWEKVQSIFIVLGYGLRMINERSGRNMFPNFGLGADDNMWRGLAASSYSSVKNADRSREDDTRSNAATAGSMADDVDGSEDSTCIPPLDDFLMRYQDPREAKFQYEQAVFAAQDPYGVKGKWMRIVNFLDYHDLFAFNFTGSMPSEGLERDPVTTAEAFRLILLRLWVTKIEWPDEEEGQPEDWETVDGSSVSGSESQPASRQTSQVDNVMQDTASSSSPPISQQASRSESTEHDKQDTATSAQVDFRSGLAMSSPVLGPTQIESDSQTPRANGKQQSTAPKKKSKYPIVHFEGRSRSLHIRWDPNANSHIRGTYPSSEHTLTLSTNQFPHLHSHIHVHISTRIHTFNI